MDGATVYIFIGAYGSGKTEVAINFAIRLREAGKDVSMVDLDIVNPYFRSRDARDALAQLGLQVVSSAAGMEQADLPALSPAILGTLQTPGLHLVFDVGGDPAGARALGRYHQALALLRPEVWMVVNTYRPETRTPEAIAAMARRLAEAGRLEITGLAANPNLGPETTLPLIRSGMEIVRAAARLLGVPLALVCAREDLADELATEASERILPLHRHMMLPWEQDSRG